MVTTSKEKTSENEDQLEITEAVHEEFSATLHERTARPLPAKDNRFRSNAV